MKDLTEYLNQHHHADIEAKGFWESVHSLEDIWCLCSIVEDGTIFLWHDYPEYDGVEVYDKDDNKTYTLPERSGSLIEGFRFWYKIGQAGGKLHVHNAMTYDKPIIEKVLPKCKIPTEAWVDTFIQSKVQFFDRSCPKGAKSAHGLKAMGIKSGVKKPDISDWTTMDAYKLHRVVEDVKIQQFTSKLLDGEKVKLESLGIDLTEALKMEAEYAKVCHEQEVTGTLVNKEHIKSCIKQWDDRLEELTKMIEPLLPMTLKPKGQKVSKKTLAGLLGYDNSKIKEDFETVKRDGELVEVEVKPYYKPVTDFTNIEKTNCYSGFHITYGDSPEYVKKKDLTAWIKTNYPNTKTKEWEIEKEIKEKVLLNKYTCEYFAVEPEDTDIISGPHTRIEYVPSRMTQHEVVKGFLIKSGIKHVKEWNFKKDSEGSFVKAKEDMVVSYPPKKLPEFQLHYTVKKGDPIVSSPKMSEDDYEQLSDDNGLLVAEYNTTMHRRRFLSNPKDPENKGLLSYVREDGRIPARVNNFMTATGRSSHGVWVNPPGAGALYGQQVRECIVAPEGRVLVGADQRSAQLSIAAYYANNYEYYKAVAEGEEFKTDEKGNEILHPDTGKPWYIGESGHCVNARAFTLVSDEEWKRAVETQDQDLIHSIGLRRKKSKGGSFACMPIDNTKVLSKKGWVKYEDLYIGMEVLTYNTETGYNEFKPIQHIVKFEDKPVYSMGNSNWCMESTKDHRWFGYRRTGRGNTRREVSEFITTENIKSEFKILNSAEKVDIINSRLTSNESAILAWLLGDGSWQWSPYSTKTSTSFGKKRGVKAVIHQTEFKYAEVLHELLIAENATTGYRVESGVNSPIRVYNVKPSYMRYLFEKARLPQETKEGIDYSELLLNLSNEALQDFLYHFWLADGHLQEDSIDISQNRGSVFDAVTLCATLLGINYSTGVNKTNYPTNKINMRIHFLKKCYTGSTNFKKECVGVRPTFCITTENSTFICKQGDTVSITGNCIFGASGKKVAATLNIPEHLGNEKKNAFLNSIGLNRVIEITDKMIAAYPRGKGGYIEVPFGYYVYCSQKHKQFNYLDQSTEAVCQKWAELYFDRESKRLGLDCKKVISMHDEFLVESAEDCAQEVGALMNKAFEEVSIALLEWHTNHSKFFVGDDLPKFAINLSAGFKIGKTYWDVH